MYHVDYVEPGKSRFEFDVKAANDVVTPLKLDVRPEALQRGMRVEVRGALLAGRRDRAGHDRDHRASRSTRHQERPEGHEDRQRPRHPHALHGFARATVHAGAGAIGRGRRSGQRQRRRILQGSVVRPAAAERDGDAVAVHGRGHTGELRLADDGHDRTNAATAAGYTLANYHKVVYVFPRVPSCGWIGLGYIGTSGVWVNGANTTLVYGHELGHNFGLSHAGSLDCGANPIGGSCSASEYGDPFGIMGNQTTMHVNAAQKSDLGWISSATVKTHTTGSATYTLNPIETAGGSAYAVKIRAADEPDLLARVPPADRVRCGARELPEQRRAGARGGAVRDALRRLRQHTATTRSSWT